jgi:hypothetical protein
LVLAGQPSEYEREREKFPEILAKSAEVGLDRIRYIQKSKLRPAVGTTGKPGVVNRVGGAGG